MLGFLLKLVDIELEREIFEVEIEGEVFRALVGGRGNFLDWVFVVYS